MPATHPQLELLFQASEHRYSTAIPAAHHMADESRLCCSVQLHCYSAATLYVTALAGCGSDELVWETELILQILAYIFSKLGGESQETQMELADQLKQSFVAGQSPRHKLQQIKLIRI